MNRDAGLEELVRDDLHAISGLSEKAMFGGWAWLLNGNLLCGSRQDGLLVRLGKDNDAWALQVAGIEPMLSGERTMHGWIRCGPGVFGDDKMRNQLLSQAIKFVRLLPSK
ncbi:TfoX/Sxy family protein [Thermomonas sp. HDW16]|uniref:TfoX/Sxy family protein n=1 Tax=Thermomonas sp. HDW16 TaxID=2714945 RepID=UPI001409C1F8|nr:TfoX/Sxy family protein [Thermomonas sp. HDW16]QIL21093.1 TfoX/Sxy family protein [Thermomonas sp. HDW16]